MGAAATLFYNSGDTEAQTLHRRITPSDEQMENQQARWRDLAEYLVAQLQEETGYNVKTWLQGSYKFVTQIRPMHAAEEFDIDLGIYYEWAGAKDEGDYTAKTLKDFVQQALEDYDDEDVREISAPKPRCARIRYTGDFHIDTPCYHLDTDTGTRTLATENGWEDSDPKAIYIWFKDSFSDLERVKVRRLIRYMKSWAALKWREIDGGRPSSILLTVLTTDAVLDIGVQNLGSDDDALRDVISAISIRLQSNDEVPNPVNRSENLCRLTANEMSKFKERLQKFKAVADAAFDKSTALEAADLWQVAFEHFFPIPDVKEDVTESVRNALVPSFKPEVRITATSKINNNAQKIVGMNELKSVPKGYDLQFDVMNANHLPAQFEISWTVRNQGQEAENVNDLGHRKGGGVSITEQTAYIGTHFMDCVVRDNGKLVAIRRIPITITGVPMPARNPARRPAYTRLKRRR